MTYPLLDFEDELNNRNRPTPRGQIDRETTDSEYEIGCILQSHIPELTGERWWNDAVPAARSIIAAGYASQRPEWSEIEKTIDEHVAIYLHALVDEDADDLVYGEDGLLEVIKDSLRPKWGSE